MIRTLTDIVLSEAVRQVNVWKQAGRPHAGRGQPVDPLPAGPAASPTTSARCCRHTGSPARELDLEITESAIMADPQRAHEMLTRLVALGVGLAIDDFGTGYSSMAHLKRLPVHEIKIDKSFVMDLVDNPSDAAIVRSMVDLGRGLGLAVVAEGVETEATWEHLLRHRLHHARRASTSSRPLPADEVLPWIVGRGAPGLPSRRRGLDARAGRGPLLSLS